MPNIILTNSCNNACEFCFAGKTQNKELKFEQIEELYHFVQRFNREAIHLIGGEPTLNKDFLAILKYLLRQNQRIVVFTNGNIRKKLVADLMLIPDQDLSFCVNRSMLKRSKSLTEFYRKVGYRIMLAVTIYKQNQNPLHLFDEIQSFKLSKVYRLGIALPNWPTRSNQFVSPEQYDTISDEMIRFIKQGVDLGIKPLFDCGFPSCFFNEEQKNFLTDQNIDFKSHCGVIPDIYHDHTLVPCLPLKEIIQPYSKDSVWETTKILLENQLNQFKKIPLFEKCNSCGEIQRGNCTGGCASFRLVK